ncbi:MAG: c-type cytochrome [Woeseiaceae bacterium]
MKFAFRMGITVLFLSAFMVAGAADLEATIVNCNDCHGADGVSQWDDMPTISGIDVFTHADALYVYRDNERACAESAYRLGDTERALTTMCEIVADLSDDDIEAIAEHYAALPFVPAAQEFDAALAQTGAALHKQECDRCHSEGGSNADDEAGIIAGQWMGYLRVAFAQYAAGERPQDKKMKEKMDPLTAADVEALLHYYASQQ